MRHYHIDWEEITQYFDEDQQQNGLWRICDVLAKIDKDFDGNAELKGLNLPFYSFVGTNYSLDPQRGFVKIFCGDRYVMLSLKKINVIQEVIPCNLAQGVVNFILKWDNQTYHKEGDHDGRTLLQHIIISMDNGINHYDVITTEASRKELETAWLISLK
jgi:hypothetical protein